MQNAGAEKGNKYAEGPWTRYADEDERMYQEWRSLQGLDEIEPKDPWMKYNEEHEAEMRDEWEKIQGIKDLRKNASPAEPDTKSDTAPKDAPVQIDTPKPDDDSSKININYFSPEDVTLTLGHLGESQESTGVQEIVDGIELEDITSEPEDTSEDAPEDEPVPEDAPEDEPEDEPEYEDEGDEDEGDEDYEEDEEDQEHGESKEEKLEAIRRRREELKQEIFGLFRSATDNLTKQGESAPVQADEVEPDEATTDEEPSEPAQEEAPDESSRAKYQEAVNQLQSSGSLSESDANILLETSSRSPEEYLAFYKGLSPELRRKIVNDIQNIADEDVPEGKGFRDWMRAVMRQL